MTVYRGIDVDEVTDSMREARDFLLARQLGPETHIYIKGNFTEEKLLKIEVAPGAEEVADRIKNSGMGWSLISYMQVFKYHAAHDPANPDGGESDAMRLYRKLASWGAFAPPFSTPNSILQGEIDHYLVGRIINDIPEEDLKLGGKISQAIDDFLGDLREEGEMRAQEAMEYFEEQSRRAQEEREMRNQQDSDMEDREEDEDGPGLQMGGEGRNQEDIIADFLKLRALYLINLYRIGGMEKRIREVLNQNREGDFMFADMIYQVSGEYDLEDQLPDDCPIREYYIPLTGMPIDTIDEDTEALVDEVMDCVMRFYKLDEVRHPYVADIPETTEPAVWLAATSRAMQHLAKMIPDLPLVDSKTGEQVAAARAVSFQPPSGPGLS